MRALASTRRACWQALALFTAACSASQASAPPSKPLSEVQQAEPRSSTQAPAGPSPVTASTAPASSTAAALPADAQSRPTDEPAQPAEPAACPDEMVLIDDEYCTEVEHDCKRHWYAKANAKKVCEEFEPHSRCVGSRVPKRYCIDKYAWPNRAGERPEVMNNFYQAQVKCAAVGKRLCTESEWTMACEGPDLLPFPYGYVRDPNKCNGDRPWDSPNMTKVAKRDPAELARLWQGVRSGSQPHCVSDYGVHDLPGNNDEVVASETRSNDYRGKYDSVHTGGPWYKGVRNQCRPKIYTHNEGFYYYFLGFRCCAEPDGEATDPRTPKQVDRGWDFSRVERLARFSVDEMKQKLKLASEGQCECDAKDILCKTMCGTLLGPEAEDAVLGEPIEEPRRAE